MSVCARGVGGGHKRQTDVRIHGHGAREGGKKGRAGEGLQLGCERGLVMFVGCVERDVRNQYSGRARGSPRGWLCLPPPPHCCAPHPYLVMLAALNEMYAVSISLYT